MCHAHLLYIQSRSPSLATCPGCHVCVRVSECLSGTFPRELPSSRHDLATFGAYLWAPESIQQKANRRPPSSSKLLAFIVSERGIEADPAKVKAVVNLCRHLVTSKSCVVCRAGSSLWSQKLELDVNPFPVKTRTLFVWRPKHKEKVLIPQTFMSAPVLSPPITGGPLLLFVFTTDAISVFLDVMAKDDDSWKERKGHWLPQTLLAKTIHLQHLVLRRASH